MDREPRSTRQRKILREALTGFGQRKHHPTAEEVFLKVRERLPDVGLATVYRNLEMLAEAGSILKLQFPRAPMRFDANNHPHHHVRCLGCGLVDDLETPIVIDLHPEEAAGTSGYRITGLHVEALGLCPACQSLPENAIKLNPDSD